MFQFRTEVCLAVCLFVFLLSFALPSTYLQFRIEGVAVFQNHQGNLTRFVRLRHFQVFHKLVFEGISNFQSCNDTVSRKKKEKRKLFITIKTSTLFCRKASCRDICISEFKTYRIIIFRASCIRFRKVGHLFYHFVGL